MITAFHTAAMKRETYEPSEQKEATNLACFPEEDIWLQVKAFFSVVCPCFTCELGIASESDSETAGNKQKLCH